MGPHLRFKYVAIQNMTFLLKPRWRTAAILDLIKGKKTSEPLNQSSSKLLRGSKPNFKIIFYLKNDLFAATKTENGRHLGFFKSQFTFKHFNQASSNVLQAFIPKFITHC